MNQKKISIIVPCYNQAQYLDDCLQSVINQTYSNWECIIVNDGSPDNTEFVAKRWLEKDNRFKYIYKKNGGLSSARNAGLKLANGDYIQLLDADDLLKPTKFEVQLKDLKTKEISVSDYFSFVDGNEELAAKHRYLSPFLSEVTFKKEIILDWEYRMSFPPHCVLFKRYLVVNHLISFNESLENHEDWEFWVKLFYHCENIFNNEEVLCLYRIRKVSMSTNYRSMYEGHLKAAYSLMNFFKNKNDKIFYKLVKKKRVEIYNKGKVSLRKKLKFILKNLLVKFCRIL